MADPADNVMNEIRRRRSAVPPSDGGISPPPNVMDEIRRRRGASPIPPPAPAEPPVAFEPQTIGGGMLDAFARDFTVGYGPRITAAEEASRATGDYVPWPFAGDNPEWDAAYADALERENAQQKQFRGDHPWLDGLTGLAGGIWGFGKIAKGGNAALRAAGRKPFRAAESTAGRIGQGAALGGAFGGVYGSSQGSNALDRATNAFMMAGMGAGLGAITVPAIDSLATFATTYGVNPSQILMRLHGAKDRLPPVVVQRVNSALEQFGMTLDDAPSMASRIDELVAGGRNVDPAHAGRQAALERAGFPTDRALVTASGSDERLLDRANENVFGEQARARAREVLGARQRAIETGAENLRLRAAEGRDLARDPYVAADIANSGVAERAAAARSEYQSGFDEFARSGSTLSTGRPNQGAAEILHNMRVAAAEKARTNVDDIPAVGDVLRQADGLLGASDTRLNQSIEKMAREGAVIADAFKNGVAAEHRAVGDYVAARFGSGAARDPVARRIDNLADANPDELRQMMSGDPYAFAALLERHSPARLADIAESIGLPHGGGKSELLRAINKRIAYGHDGRLAVAIPEHEATMLMRAHDEGQRGGLLAMLGRERMTAHDAGLEARRAATAERLAKNIGRTEAAEYSGQSQELQRGVSATSSADDAVAARARAAEIMRESNRRNQMDLALREGRINQAEYDAAISGPAKVADLGEMSSGAVASADDLASREIRMARDIEDLGTDRAGHVVSRPEKMLDDNPVFRDWERRRRTLLAERGARNIDLDTYTGMSIRSEVPAENVQQVLAAIEAKIRSLKGFGPGTGQADEKQALLAMKNSVNAWLDVASVGGKKGITAPPGAIDALRRGRSAFRSYMERFRANPDAGASPGVRAASRMIDRMAQESASAEDVAAFIRVGATANKAGTRDFARSMREMFGAESDDFMAIRQAMFGSLLTGRGNTMKSAVLLANDLDQFFFGQGRLVANEVFGGIEGFEPAVRNYITALRMVSSQGASRNVSRTDISREEREAEGVMGLLRMIGLAGRVSGGISPTSVVGTAAGVGIVNAVGSRAGRRAIANIHAGGAPSDPRSVIFPSVSAPEIVARARDALLMPADRER